MIFVLIGVDSDESMQPPFKIRNSKLCSFSSLTQATSKCFAQTARMHRLV